MFISNQNDNKFLKLYAFDDLIKNKNVVVKIK